MRYSTARACKSRSGGPCSCGHMATDREARSCLHLSGPGSRGGCTIMNAMRLPSESCATGRRSCAAARHMRSMCSRSCCLRHRNKGLLARWGPKTRRHVWEDRRLRDFLGYVCLLRHVYGLFRTQERLGLGNPSGVFVILDRDLDGPDPSSTRLEAGQSCKAGVVYGRVKRRRKHSKGRGSMVRHHGKCEHDRA